MIKFFCVFKKTTAISIILLFLLFPIALSIPDWVCYENHLIDNLQVVILFLGCALTIYFYYHDSIPEFQNFWLICLSIFSIMILRELSWGRVFYPTGFDEKGPTFISLNELWYGAFVHPILAIIIIITVFQLIKDIRLLHKNKRLIYLSLIDFIAFLLMGVCSQLLFEKGVIAVLKPYAQNLEECAELIAYWSLVSMIVWINLRHKALCSAPAPSAHLADGTYAIDKEVNG